MTKVVIVDPKGIISSAGDDVIKRHLEYGVALRSLESSARLYVLSKHSNNNSVNNEYFEMISARTLMGFFKNGVKLLRLTECPVVLVSGDPWESFLCSIILRKVSGVNCPIQVQLHADAGSNVWRSLNWRNRIRAPFLSIALNRATQLRCVSKNQLENLKKFVPSLESRAVVIPVPIKIDSTWKKKRKSKSSHSIALVGRIHKDRGLEEFVRVCGIISVNCPELTIFIVGEGPHENWLRVQLGRVGILDRTVFLGRKTQVELNSLWRNFGCVASFAPSESYGRSAREALIHGVPILAKQSSGLRELQDFLQDGGLWILDELSDLEIIKCFKSASTSIISFRDSEAIVKEVELLSMKLANSWINALKLIQGQSTKSKGHLNGNGN
jgi:glycosyltransferase involved in cell wall biosynthesis